MTVHDLTPRTRFGIKNWRPRQANSSDPRGLESRVLKLRGKEWQRYPPEKRESFVQECFQYWRAHGFPYYRLNDEEISKEYHRFQAASSALMILGTEIMMSMVGIKLANFFHPQMWSVPVGARRSPKECFKDDKALRELIRKALIIWPDRYSVNDSNLRRMLKTFSHTASVSNFRPTAAKAIYEKYSKAGDCVLDFSAGYGGRLLGCMPLARHYIGVDPSRSQIKGLNNMTARVAKLARVKARTDIYQACAEDFMPQLKDNSVALVFSSPPYFNHERYSNEHSQSYRRFPVYDDWVKGFLCKVVAESWRVLRPGGYLILNVADVNGHKLVEDTLLLASPFFTLTAKLKLRLGHIPYLRAQPAETYKYEPVFVFRKDRR
jgi:SAM-dependent methyltransferase